MKELKNNFTIIVSLLSVIIIITGFIFIPSRNKAVVKQSKANISIASSGLAFVCHASHNFISVIDIKTNKVVDTITAGEGTVWFTLSKDRKTAYAANFQSNNISIIHTDNPKNSEIVAVGKNPMCICLAADEQSALISHQSQDGLWFMNIKTYQVTKKIGEGTGLMQLTKDGRKIYQPAIFRPYVHVINPYKKIISKSIYVGGRPLNIYFTPDGKYAYVTNYDLNEVQIIDTKTDSVVNKLSNIDGPRGIAVSPDGKYVLVTNVILNKVTVIDVKNNFVVKKISVDKMPTDIAITKDGKYAYVTNQGSGSIAVISIDKLEVINNIEVPDNPISIYLSE